MSIATRIPPDVTNWQQLRSYLRSQPIWRAKIYLKTADGVKTEISPSDLGVQLWVDVDNRPVATVVQAGASIPYTDDDPPAAYAWHLRLHPQVLVFGTPPVATDQLQNAATTGPPR